MEAKEGAIWTSGKEKKQTTPKNQRHIPSRSVDAVRESPGRYPGATYEEKL